LKQDDQVGATGRSSRADQALERILYAVTTRQLPLIAAATGRPPRIEPNTAYWAAPVPAWWDRQPRKIPTPR